MQKMELVLCQVPVRLLLSMYKDSDVALKLFTPFISGVINLVTKTARYWI